MNQELWELIKEYIFEKAEYQIDSSLGREAWDNSDSIDEKIKSLIVKGSDKS